MTRLLNAALRYSQRRWAVFPCRPRAKVPATPHGCKDATHDVEQVRRWWTDTPDANIGVATGAPSGIFVVDFDGDDGRATARDWIAMGRSLKALWQRTPSGGYHAVFTMPNVELPNSARKLGAGVDTRGDGGYILAAPSVHPNGGRYEWPDQHRVPSMPGWLFGLLRVLPPDRPQYKPGTTDANAYVDAAIQSCLESLATAPEGTRNHTLNACSYSLGRLVGAGYLTKQQVWEALQPAALAAGLQRRETQQTILSGLRSGEKEPNRL